MKYISSIFKTGAVRKTPDRIIRKILAEIDPSKRGGVIEFGAGKGEITSKILELTSANSSDQIPYYAFEIDPQFANALRSRLAAVNILSEDAFAFNDFVPRDLRPDYIICSIPLSFYSSEKIDSLLEKMKATVAAGGKIIILFHAFWLVPFLRKRLKAAKLHRFLTIPPYFLMIQEK